VTLDNVWVGGFNGAIGVHDFQGRPVAKESDIPASPAMGTSGSRMARRTSLCISQVAS
jgi:hypothetical protein